jgi:sugar lactone lactonase YvrE
VTQADVLADVHDTLGESPVWLDAAEALYWVDAELHLVHRRTLLDERVDTVSLAVPVTALIPRSGGGWILVTKDGLFSASQDFSRLALVVDPARHEPGTRLNDGVADRWGRVWTGSMSRATVEDPVGRLYLVGPGDNVTEVDGGFAVANGIAMSPDGSRAYVSDMFHAQIRVYGLDPRTGDVVDRLPAIQTRGPGYPDGLAVDREGALWVAYWDGARVDRLDASGRVLSQVMLPVDQVTRCCLGGRSGSQLFVTTARFELDATQLRRQPHAGALFTANTESIGDPPAAARL